MNNFVESPVLWIFPLLGFFCPLLTVMAIYRGRPGWGFLMASLMQFGVIFTAGITLFPFCHAVKRESNLQPDVVGQHFQSADAEHYVGNRADIFCPLCCSTLSGATTKCGGRMTTETLRRNENELY